LIVSRKRRSLLQKFEVSDRVSDLFLLEAIPQGKAKREHSQKWLAGFSWPEEAAEHGVLLYL